MRLVGVGPSIASPGGFHPSRHTRVEKRIIGMTHLYLLVSAQSSPLQFTTWKEKEKRGAFTFIGACFVFDYLFSQIPFANDVRDVTMARRVSVVLVSPEKVGIVPES